jgi:hypothetical protein
MLVDPRFYEPIVPVLPLGNDSQRQPVVNPIPQHVFPVEELPSRFSVTLPQESFLNAEDCCAFGHYLGMHVYPTQELEADGVMCQRSA